MKVIGAGLGRTGTNSLKIALEHLGFGPCYHMYEVKQNPDHVALWEKAITHSSIDHLAFLSRYNSATDWPMVSFLPQVIKHFPDIKVVLTTRKPEDWYESARKTIFLSMEYGIHSDDSITKERMKMANKLVLKNTFDNKHHNKDHCISIYNTHIKKVKQSVLPKNLLEYSPVDGWEPLCLFLNKSIPTIDFPHTNTLESFLTSKPK